MKKKDFKKKLSLSKSTIASLNSNAMHELHGGGPGTSWRNYCVNSIQCDDCIRFNPQEPDDKSLVGC